MQISCVISRRQGWIHSTVFPLWSSQSEQAGRESFWKGLFDGAMFFLSILSAIIHHNLCLNSWTKSCIACVHLCVVWTSVCVCQSGNLDVHAWPVTERFLCMVLPHGSRNWYAAHIVCVCICEREKRERETYWDLCCMHAAGMKMEQKNEGGKDQLIRSWKSEKK